MKTNKLFTNCFSSSHFVTDCKSHLCNTCQQKHNTLLHQSSTSQLGNNFHGSYSQRYNPQKNQTSHYYINNSSQSNCRIPQPHQASNYYSGEKWPNNSLGQSISCTDNTAVDSNESNYTIMSRYTPSGEILLATALVTVATVESLHSSKVILDCCSTNSLIIQSLCKELKYKVQAQNVSTWRVNAIITQSNKVVSLKICSNVNRHFNLDVSCLVVPNITKRLNQLQLSRNKIEIAPNVILAYRTFTVPSQIDKCCYNLMCGGHYYTSQFFYYN